MYLQQLFFQTQNNFQDIKMVESFAFKYHTCICLTNSTHQLLFFQTQNKFLQEPHMHSSDLLYPSALLPPNSKQLPRLKNGCESFAFKSRTCTRLTYPCPLSALLKSGVCCLWEVMQGYCLSETVVFYSGAFLCAGGWLGTHQYVKIISFVAYWIYR